MSDAVAGNASHMVTSKTRKASFSNDVWAVQLSPSFFKQTDPNFSVSAVSKDWLVVFARQKIVDNYRLLHSIYVEVHEIATRRVQFFRMEKCHDIFWIFSNRTENSQEVAITKCSLINIIRIYSIPENKSILIDLVDPLPIHFLKAFFVTEWFYGRRELWILPWLTKCYNIVHFFYCLSDFLFVLLLFL